MRQLVVAVFAAAIVNAGACGGASTEHDSGPHAMPRSGTAGALTGGSGNASAAGGVGGGVGTGGTGVAAGGTSGSGAGAVGAVGGAGAGAGGGGNVSAVGGTGATTAAGSGGQGDGAGGSAGSGLGESGGGAGEGQGGESACGDSTRQCECDWLAPSCSAGENLYAGQSCPPTFDEATRVANWPLGGPPMIGTTRKTGEFEQCDDGTQSFQIWLCDSYDNFTFDPEGRLSSWSQLAKFCSTNPCASSPRPSATCRICTMVSDPPAEGTQCFFQGPNNGPSPQCMVDAHGRWLMPPLCPPTNQP